MAKIKTIIAIFGIELTIVMLIAAGMTLHDLLVVLRENGIKRRELKEQAA